MALCEKILRQDLPYLLTALLILSVLHQYEARSHAQDVDNHAFVHT